MPPDWATIVASALTSAHLMFAAPADPAGPVGPLAPVVPLGPVAPVGPAGPAGPLGIWPFLKSTLSSEWFFTLLLTTALFFSWAVPTLFLGSAVAAQLTPPSARSRATHAMTIAGDGRWRRRRAIMSRNPLVVVLDMAESRRSRPHGPTSTFASEDRTSCLRTFYIRVLSACTSATKASVSRRRPRLRTDAGPW